MVIVIPVAVFLIPFAIVGWVLARRAEARRVAKNEALTREHRDGGSDVSRQGW